MYAFDVFASQFVRAAAAVAVAVAVGAAVLLLLLLLFHQTSILNWLFGVPGCDIFTYKLLEGLVLDLCLHNTVGIWSVDSDMAAVFDYSSGGLHGEGAPAGIFAAGS